MGGEYIVVSSITYAYKGKSVLDRKGIRAVIEKAPKELSNCGCYYALLIKNAGAKEAAELLKAAHVKFLSVGGAADDLS